MFTIGFVYPSYTTLLWQITEIWFRVRNASCNCSSDIKGWVDAAMISLLQCPLNVGAIHLMVAPIFLQDRNDGVLILHLLKRGVIYTYTLCLLTSLFRDTYSTIQERLELLRAIPGKLRLCDTGSAFWSLKLLYMFLP